MMRLIVLLFAALALSSPALAWGEYGHRTTAAIAMANVQPRTAAKIRLLLRAEAGLGTPQCAVRSLEDASVWPDCLRGEGWRWGYSFAWHYQTQPVCGTFDVKANCANGNCVTAQIERSRRILANRRLPAAQRLEALAFLVHFTGDVHMPLHSGDNGDLGGNAVSARYGIAPGRNLHSVWDGVLAERAISAAVPPLVRRYSPAEKAELAGGTVADWARESWVLASQMVYPLAFDAAPCAGPAPRAVIWTDADIEASIPALQKRIEQAGLRLARELDAALGG